MATMDNLSITLLILVAILFLYNLVRSVFNRKYYKNFQKIPSLQLPLEGMFVKVEGIVASENNTTTPISKKSCAFYQLQTKGEYQVKEKSPRRGYKTVTKKINTEQSKKRILIDKEQQIFIEIKENQSVILSLRNSTKEQKKPISSYHKKYKKATKYIYKEQYIQKGDRVVVYGRLIKKNNIYIITHTYSQKLPFMLYINNPSKLEKSYRKKININIFFMLLALGMGGYIWW